MTKTNRRRLTQSNLKASIDYLLQVLCIVTPLTHAQPEGLIYSQSPMLESISVNAATGNSSICPIEDSPPPEGPRNDQENDSLRLSDLEGVWNHLKPMIEDDGTRWLKGFLRKPHLPLAAGKQRRT